MDYMQHNHYANDAYAQDNSAAYYHDTAPHTSYEMSAAQDQQAVGMAGVGARRMAQKQQRQMQQRRLEEEEAERQRWQAEEEHRRYEEEQWQQQEWYAHQQRQQEEEERRRAAYEEEEQQRRLYAQQQQEEQERQHYYAQQQHEEQERQQYYAQQQKEEEERRERQKQQAEREEQAERRLLAEQEEEHNRRIVEEKRRRWQEENDQLRRQQEQQEQERAQLKAQRLQQQREQQQQHSDSTTEQEFWISQSTQRGKTRRAQTDSQATVRPNDYDNSVSPSTLKVSTSTAATDARRTMYEDDYEEPDRTEVTSSFDGNSIVRDTVYEHLPKATCADCGEKFPFDDLVDHVCVRDACRSPLLTKGVGSLAASPTGTPSLDESRSRSPFFDRYEQAQKDESGRLTPFLSPALHPSNRSTPSPRLRHIEPDRPPSPQSQSLPIMGASEKTKAAQAEQVQESIRQERKRQIEAQRAAKKNALRLQTSASSSMLRAAGPATDPSILSPMSMPSLSPVERSAPVLAVSSSGRSHRRGVPGSQSSCSTVSTNTSLSSFFGKNDAGTITPSSSIEQVGSIFTTSAGLSKKKINGGSPPKKSFDLQDLEGLVREIKNTPASPPRQQSAREPEETATQRQKPNKSQTLDVTPSQRVPQRSRKLSSNVQPAHKDARRPSDSAVSAHASAEAVRLRSRLKETSTAKANKKKLCSVCLKAFERNQPMVQRDGAVLCLDDYAELYLEKCRKCQQAVRTVGVRSRDGALPGLFHRECFSCLDCNAKFEDGTFYVYDGAPYCAEHYHAHNGTTCAGCQTGIEGQCRQLTDSGERFHLRCLTCQFDDGREFCKDLLHDYYVYDGKRLCAWHFDKTMQAKRARDDEANGRRGARRANKDERAAEVRAARRTTLLRTVSARKARA